MAGRSTYVMASNEVGIQIVEVEKEKKCSQDYRSANSSDSVKPVLLFYRQVISLTSMHIAGLAALRLLHL